MKFSILKKLWGQTHKEKKWDSGGRNTPAHQTRNLFNAESTVQRVRENSGKGKRNDKTAKEYARGGKERNTQEQGGRRKMVQKGQRDERTKNIKTQDEKTCLGLAIIKGRKGTIAAISCGDLQKAMAWVGRGKRKIKGAKNTAPTQGEDR